MAKEFPVGTIRDWVQGAVIKAHDPYPPFSSGWIPLKTSKRFDSIGRECDGYASSILSHKLPINGEKFLDYEIDQFGEQINQEKFFSADNFKKYQGFNNAGRYAFRNEFSRLFMKNDMDLDEAICEAMIEANKDVGGDKDNDKLSKEDKKNIRERVKREFKSHSEILTEEKALMLLEIVKRTKKQVEEGLDFKDPEQKKVYDQFKEMADKIPESYELIKEKRKKKFEAIDLIENTFQDNWGVRESCKDYIQKKFDDYVRKYSDQISKDSIAEQIEQFGVSIEMEPDKFYSKIYEKAKGTDYSFLERFVGKEINITDSRGRNSRRVKIFKVGEEFYYKETDNTDDIYGGDVNLISRLQSGYIKLAPEYNELGDSFKDLIYLRFLKKYNKSVEGDWTLEHLPAIQNLENIINELPEGHFLTNEHLNLITNKTYKGGNSGGYAWYSEYESRINLSADCVERSTVWGVLSNPTEFKSVVLHEIGHAVDAKLNKDHYYNRKRFVVDCGWTYQSPALRAGMTATGDQKSIPRTGSNASISLITDYSSKSPSEAFAEYYSFYNLNKKRFDKFFETGDKKHLGEHSKIVSKQVSSERTISDMLPGRGAIGMTYWDNYKEVESSLSDRGRESHKITLNSPWEMKFSHEEKKKLDPSRIRHRKDYSIHSMPPIVVVKNGKERIVIDGGVRVEVARMNKQMVPSIEIPKELYFKLREKGLNDSEVSDCIYTVNRDRYVPKQIAPSVRVEGLLYRDEIVPVDQILENYDSIKTMKEICESKELEKALSEIFEKSLMN